MQDNISINDVTIGYSVTGAEQYLRDLNAQAITETKRLLGENVQSVITALEAGWVGQAQLNYVANLQKSILTVQNTLDSLKETLDTQFANLEETWREQDKNIVPLD